MTHDPLPPDALASATAAESLEIIARAFASAGLYFGHGTAGATDEAAWLFGFVHDIDYAADDWQLTFEQALATPLTAAQRQQLARLASRRIASRKPLAYIIGEAWFAGYRFVVDERVLVPRSPIAALIETGFAPWADPGRPGIGLDLCTGSGCIAIAAALTLPGWRFDASDISTAALAVARRNVHRHAVADRVRLLCGDLFAAVDGGVYDLIVTNPPYVDAEEMTQRPAEYRHEPELGLAAGDDGLSIITRILAAAPDYLEPHGVLIAEVGASDEALQAAFAEVPFTWLEFDDDSRGVFVAERELLLAHHAAFVARLHEADGER